MALDFLADQSFPTDRICLGPDLVSLDMIGGTCRRGTLVTTGNRGTSIHVRSASLITSGRIEITGRRRLRARSALATSLHPTDGLRMSDNVNQPRAMLLVRLLVLPPGTSLAMVAGDRIGSDRVEQSPHRGGTSMACREIARTGHLGTGRPTALVDLTLGQPGRMPSPRLPTQLRGKLPPRSP